MANVNVLAPVFSKKVTAGLDLHYVSPVGTLGGNKTQSFVVTNLTVFSHQLYKQFEISGTIYNLFDTQYGYPGGGEHTENVIYQDGRSARLKLTYTLHTEKRASH